MPRTNGCSCSAAQIGSAAARSWSAKAFGERIPVQELIGLQQARRTAGARRLPARDEPERAPRSPAFRAKNSKNATASSPYAGRSASRMRAQLRPQVSRFARKASATSAESRQRQPGNVRRIGLAAGKRLVFAAEPHRGGEALEQSQRLGLPAAISRKNSPAGGSGKRCIRCSKLFRSLVMIARCSPAKIRSASGVTRPLSLDEVPITRRGCARPARAPPARRRATQRRP
jgi:hypothetical protein